ncbi:MAG TPA: hypothetical protein VJZ70_01150 [Limnochordia bacterium]|nr:hypothetical protein [Limnochordia bacterium]
MSVRLQIMAGIVIGLLIVVGVEPVAGNWLNMEKREVVCQVARRSRKRGV